MDYHDYIWDLGGTLLDNYGLSTKAFLSALAEFGISAASQDVYDKLKESTAAAVSYYAPDIPEFLKIYKQTETKFLENPILFKGAKEVLEKIVACGGRNFLVSHRNNQVLTILEKTGIDFLFTEVVTSNNGFARKPNPESMLYLKDKYNITKGLVIGDREIDIEAGRAAGFATMLVDGSQSLIEIVT
ncbi:HAD-IA family hydrolase [Streptococcus macacae]|uniref:HAD hydrolase, family IA, variant 1 n=1 Tax=Streptococcus macacae NCTC 11558 TaxID=764298 RepID=G5JYW1_9STRE|nr:HAD-IA family hydrolase [Streptococcus macacae]EHJ52345.1 HAD hydrolase, family IA, variant 1 [Streptococcus macacae NCTC 11558]SUN78218.1 putative hydrolase [Streptococcus macacae NCTC 11558]